MEEASLRSCVREIMALRVEPDGRVDCVSQQVLNERELDVYINGVRAMSVGCIPHDIPELVTGRLFTEGYIDAAADILDLRVTDDPFCAYVTLADAPAEAPAECVLEGVAPAAWSLAEVLALRDDFAKDTAFHALTGGTHSCRLAIDGVLTYVCEDIGRHNAMDKVIGRGLIDGVDFARTMIFTSGRIPLDMARKAIRAKVPVLATKASPTDEGIRLCREYGIALVYVKDKHTPIVYSGMDRLTF